MAEKKKPVRRGLKIGKPLGKNSKLRKFRAKKAVAAKWEAKINKEINDPFGKVLKKLFEPQRKAYKKTQKNIRATKIAKSVKAKLDAITKGNTPKGAARRKEVKSAKHAARQAKMELDIKVGEAKRKATKHTQRGMRIMGSKNMTGGSPGTRRFLLKGSEADKVATKAMKKRMKKDKGLKRRVVKSKQPSRARQQEVKGAAKKAKSARYYLKDITERQAYRNREKALPGTRKERQSALTDKRQRKYKRQRLLKGAGKVVKAVAKRSPIIGGLTSFPDYKDAFKRVAKHDQKKYDKMKAKAKKHIAKKKKK
jgi:hypothetical protein